jgi:hypothetical protein
MICCVVTGYLVIRAAMLLYMGVHLHRGVVVFSHVISHVISHVHRMIGCPSDVILNLFQDLLIGSGWCYVVE